MWRNHRGRYSWRLYGYGGETGQDKLRNGTIGVKVEVNNGGGEKCDKGALMEEDVERKKDCFTG